MALRKPDRKKYLQIIKEKGVDTALSELHAEMREIEHESFEGPKGYQPDLWESIKKYREFSTEVWNMDPSRQPIKK